MKTVGVFDAKTHLSELIASGEVVTITKHGKPIATLAPVRHDAAAAVNRIKALRSSGGVTLSENAIVEMTRKGRR
jgi:prevent-host-death family protein